MASSSVEGICNSSKECKSDGEQEVIHDCTCMKSNREHEQTLINDSDTNGNVKQDDVIDGSTDTKPNTEIDQTNNNDTDTNGNDRQDKLPFNANSGDMNSISKIDPTNIDDSHEQELFAYVDEDVNPNRENAPTNTETEVYQNEVTKDSGMNQSEGDFEQIEEHEETLSYTPPLPPDRTDWINRFKAMSACTMENVMRYIGILKRDGIKDMQNEIQNDLNEWKHVGLNIALVGESGSGKSSLINAILGLTADDEGAADVGCKETTFEEKSYVHPEHENVTFFDLPGIGTPNFPKNEYLNKINLDKYDFFLIVSRGRFRDNDKWFAKMIEKKNLHVYFVRTCIDHDILDNEKAHPKTHNKQKLIVEIREDIKNNLLKAGLNEENIFIALVNCHNELEHDFSTLMTELIKNAPAIKRKAVIFAFFSRSKEVIETKIIALKDRMAKTAIMASVGSLVPLPGVGEFIEIVAIYNEAQFYRKQLQIDDKSLEELAKNMNKDLNDLKKKADISSNILFASTQSLLKFLALFLQQKVLNRS